MNYIIAFDASVDCLIELEEKTINVGVLHDIAYDDLFILLLAYLWIRVPS